MGYWKSKVLPTINKVFKKDTAKKSAAAEATKSFDDSKEEINKDFEEKKSELQPKVIEIYEASSTEIKTLVKEPKEAGLKKHSALVQKFLDDLVKIEFPGSKAVSEASSKFGPNYVSGPVFFVFEKVSSFIVVDEKTAPEESSSKQKEIVVEEEKAAAEIAAEKTQPPSEPPPPAAEPASKVLEEEAATKVEPEPPKP